MQLKFGLLHYRIIPSRVSHSPDTYCSGDLFGHCDISSTTMNFFNCYLVNCLPDYEVFFTIKKKKEKPKNVNNSVWCLFVYYCVL